MIHVGINDILQSNSENDLKELPNNIIDIARTCRSYNSVKYSFRQSYHHAELSLTQKV